MLQVRTPCDMAKGEREKVTETRECAVGGVIGKEAVRKEQIS